MRIPNFINIDGIFYHLKEGFFAKGNLIEGEIIEVEDDLVLIHIKDVGIIKAKSESHLSAQEGKILNFIVKDIQKDCIQLKPILPNVTKEKDFQLATVNDEKLVGILEEYNIKPTTSSAKFLKNLMEFNIPIDKDNVVRGVWLTDKLEQLINLKENTVPILASTGNLEIDVSDILKEDIRNILVIEGNEVEDNKESNISYAKDFTGVINEFVKDFPKLNDDLLQKTVIFFMKYNIKPSLKNVKYFLELELDPSSFSKDFEMLKEFNVFKFTNPIKRFIIDNDGVTKTIEQENIKYVNILSKTISLLKDIKADNEKTKEIIEELIDKCSFLKDMNKELIFIHLPLNMDKDYKDTIITFLKNRKQEKGYKNKLNIFINLNTKRLGTIRIACLVWDNYIDVKFSGINKEDIYLFESRENLLRNLVETTGYEIRTVEYINRDFTSILDTLKLNITNIFNLDIRV